MIMFKLPWASRFVPPGTEVTVASGIAARCAATMVVGLTNHHPNLVSSPWLVKHMGISLVYWCVLDMLETSADFGSSQMKVFSKANLGSVEWTIGDVHSVLKRKTGSCTGGCKNQMTPVDRSWTALRNITCAHLVTIKCPCGCGLNN